MLAAAALVAFTAALVPATPRLEDALSRAGSELRTQSSRVDLGPVASRSERVGAFLYRYVPLRLSERAQRSLRLQGRSIAAFYGDKAALAIAGAMTPAVLGFCATVVLGTSVAVPVLAAAVGLVAGFFVPDLMLLRSSAAARSSAVGALLVFIDLVTLERLANASATQALQNAATVSDFPLFMQMRVALERARLEQHSPYGELRRLAEEMNLPELNDVADVMQLDESGAALSDALRARVKELRDAHLTAEQVAAVAAAEGMTIYMALPALIFGLIFMGAALLRILG
jgi:Flp pilus assembly protein TadB